MQRMPSAFAFAVNCVRERVRKREGKGARQEKKTTCSRIALQLLEHLRREGGKVTGEGWQGQHCELVFDLSALRNFVAHCCT